jgi:hypothetical protein
MPGVHQALKPTAEHSFYLMHVRGGGGLVQSFFSYKKRCK